MREASVEVSHYRPLSLWHDTLPEGDLRPRPPLDGSVDVDVAIVGAGYTGLWSAYYLALSQPDLSVAVIEAEIAGFGASGRNGGWASGEFSMRRREVASTHGRSAVTSMLEAVFRSIDEIASVTVREGIDCHFAKGGSLELATSAPQLARLRRLVEEEHGWGFGEDDFRLLDRDDTRRRVRSQRALASVYTPHCAALHPARLAHGLAQAVERRGVRIYERTRARSIEPNLVRTDRGDVRAGAVLSCLEAFEVRMPRRGRASAPVYSLMIATAPLDDAAWERVGLSGRETFHDGRHLVIYGQRTADGRLAFGGRGAPYHLGSSIRPEHEQDPATHKALAGVLRWLFDQLGDVPITHTWGGAVAVPRDWSASVSFDPRTGMGRAGGYVGAGVTAANLAGRTLADLVLGRDTDRTRLPWVGHRSPRWEPEPLRWAGINLGRSLAPMADAIEFRTGRPARLVSGLLDRLTGG